MSLVVAEATDAGPRIVSDTRVTLAYDERPSYKTGTLKAVIVTPAVTICFAGDVVAGLEGVREFAKGLRDGRSVEDLLPRLQRLSTDRRRSVEFIVARGDRPIRSQLIRIRNGEIGQGLLSMWIGDQAAFERFQQERNRTLTPFEAEIENERKPEVTVMLRLSRSMQVVIEDPAIVSVGDFCVRVGYGAGGFQYLESMFMHVGRDFIIQSEDELISRMARPVEEGGFSVSVVEPLEPGTPALGLSFPRARLGMLYLPLEYDGARVFGDVSPNHFARVVRERFGVAMKDPMLRYV